MTIILESLENAIASLDESVSSFKDLNPNLEVQFKQYKFVRDSVIQRFEYTYELSWKFLKRVLKEIYNLDESSVKNVYREAGNLNLISDVELWFKYHQERNLTSHTYIEAQAEQTAKTAIAFLEDAKRLLNKLRESLDAN